jgi:hypothetical protein
MMKSQWIVKKSEDEHLIAASVKRKGKVFLCSPVEPLKDSSKLSGLVHLSLESSKAEVIVEEFPKVKDDILELQIQNKLDQLALFSVGEEIATSYAILEERRQKQLLSLIAQPENLTGEGIGTITSGGKVDLKSCVSAVAAIAALMKQLDPDPYIVLLITRISAYLIGVRNGFPLFLQSVPLSAPAEVESGVAAHAIGFGRQTLQRDFEIDSCRLVCLGEGRESFDFEALEEENWIPDWNHCITAEGGDILHYPALFGSLFIEERYSMLPVEYVRAGQLKKVSFYLSIAAGIGCIVLAALAYQHMERVAPLQQQLELERRQLSENAGKVRRVTPDPEMVDRVKVYLEIMDKADAEPSVAMLLEDIARALPENVFADKLKISRKIGETDKVEEDPMGIPPPGMDTAMPDSPGVVVSGSPAEALLGQTITVHLACSSKGDYSMVKARFDQTVKGLSARFSLRNVDWDYSETEGGGSFGAELLPAGEEQ